MTSRAPLAAVAGLMALSAAPADAAPPWSPPVSVSAPRSPRVEANEVDQAGLVPRVTAGEGGLQLATWRGPEAVRVLVALDGDRVLRVRTSRSAAASARYARTRILHLDARRVGQSAGFPTVRLGYRLGEADLSAFGASRSLGGPRTIAHPPVLAVNASGAAIAAWRHVRRGRSDEVQIAARPAGGRFGAVRTVQDADIPPDPLVAVGIDAGGRAVVAYARRTVRGRPARLAVRVLDTRTGALSAESRVAPPAGVQAPAEITVGAQPRTRGLPMVVAWRGYPVTEGPTGTVDTAAAVLPAAGTRLAAPQRLATGRLVGYPRGPISAAVDAAGRPVVAWSELTRAPARTIPTVAQADASGRFVAPQALDTAGSIGSLVVQDEGLAVGWLRETPGGEGHGFPLGVMVARRGPDGPFGPGELVDDRSSTGPLATNYDGLQPPGLGLLPSGGLLAAYADIGPNQEGGGERVSVRPPGP